MLDIHIMYMILYNYINHYSGEYMTRKDYIAFADIFTKSLNKVDKGSVTKQMFTMPEVLAIIEDCIALFESDNPNFNKQVFIKYINKNRDSDSQLLI